jgi:hypothetical protein
MIQLDSHAMMNRKLQRQNAGELVTERPARVSLKDEPPRLM